MKWEELKTPEAVLAAFEAGRRVEFTAMQSDSIDMPPHAKQGSGGWIIPSAFGVTDPKKMMTECGGRYRALIEDPAIPAGYTPWGGGECPEDARGKFPELIFRNGMRHQSRLVGEAWRWSHDTEHGDHGEDIIAYRVESEQAQITQGTCSSHCAATGECTNACAPINAQPSQQGEAVSYTVRCVHETTNTADAGVYFLEVKTAVPPKEGAKLFVGKPPADEVKSPSYDALLIIAQSVAGALARAGVTDCDDPGEAIDVLRERWERSAEPLGRDADSFPSLINELIQHHEMWLADARESGHEDAVRFHGEAVKLLRKQSEGPGGEDGPWADGWEERSKPVSEPFKDGRDAEGGEGLEEDIQLALDYSRNFATAKPNIGKTEKEHILGLCDLLEKTARRLRPQVDEAMADRALWVMFPHPYDEHLRKNWRPKVVEALTAALTEADSHGK